MTVGDVGQAAWEEVDYEPAGRGGRNYGWRIREGAHLTSGISDTTSATLTDPIIEYSHAVGNSITGGRVNRGTGLGLDNFGRYFFADLNGRVWSARITLQAGSTEAVSATLTEHTADLGGASAVGMPVAFGTDASCRVYIVDYTGGRILRLLPASLSTSSTCATPDPFVSLGGGTFLGDGWVPPAIPSRRQHRHQVQRRHPPRRPRRVRAPARRQSADGSVSGTAGCRPTIRWRHRRQHLRRRPHRHQHRHRLPRLRRAPAVRP